MQVTIDSNDPLDQAVRVLSSLYGVELTVVESGAPAPAAATAAATTTATAPRRAARRTTKKAPSRPAKKAAKKSATPRTATRRPRRIRSTEDLAAVRAWARDNGFTVSDRGRVSNEVLAAYDSATASA